jgi:hypothetical protein
MDDAGLAWVHPQCSPDYARAANARWALLALTDDPLEVDHDGWVPRRAVEAQRGLWDSDSADFEAGLAQLIEGGWVEADSGTASFRPTAAGLRHIDVLG